MASILGCLLGGRGEAKPSLMLQLSCNPAASPDSKPWGKSQIWPRSPLYPMQAKPHKLLTMSGPSYMKWGHLPPQIPKGT